jgi:hypothetical protein
MAYAEHSSTTTTAEAPALRLGLRARWRAARDARIVSPRARRRLAEDLEEAVFRAERPTAPLSAVVPVSLDAARGARCALLDLAERLRAPRPVDPVGMRMTRALLIDGSGPLYVPLEPGELRHAARRALWALDRRSAIE